ncbi:unnamed protein product (macronuclear) [Paramecium tetraurelia]|uniref:Transmembrane protein n=1 Tax=Paramecium tetraurelia TaxID=5888 RepID=A0C8E3_PARTE|nr:uncharacterized protein GSPATT00036193001 [Paramecium tetraurelia]CAK67060.1 unnamed protein product [Paramecium tetraurelia]|eukprot:XP_001434457.1 hypothetical protein (macronuclear) [Paramecium tetraurelia strain d4-2]
MFLEILLFFVILKNSQTQTCEEKAIDKNNFFISSFTDAFLIETDEADFSKINGIGYDVLIFEYSQHYELEGILISAKLLESFQNKSELQICNLINKEISYFIQCIIGLTFIQEEIDLNYSNKTEIITLPNEICQSIFYDQEQIFTIFCYSEENFQLISVNLDNQAQFYQLYNYPQDSELKLCTPISIQFQPFHYLIGYLNCSDWRIFRALDNNITLILDQGILNGYQNDVTLTNLVNLQICQKNNMQRYLVYALFDTGYVKFEDIKVSVFLLKTQEHKITQLIFDRLCNVAMFVGQEESLIPFQYYSQYSTITFSKSIPPPVVHAHEQFKILQLEKTLQVFINQKFIQYYDISGLLLFDRTFNYFFAIHPSLNQIKLYKIKHLSRYLLPQRQYIYDFNLRNFNCCDKKAIKCTKIIKQDPSTLLQEYDFGVNEQYLISQKQQSEIKIFIDYLEFMDGIPLFFEVPPEYKHLLSIDEMKIKFSSICQQQSTIQDSNILFFDASIKIFIFQDQKNIYFYNCTQQRLFRHEQIQNKSVFTTKNYVIIIDGMLNLINIIVMQQQSIKKHLIKIDSEIINAKLILNYIFITLKDKEPLIIEIQSDDKILYNSVSSNKDDILFYFKDYNSSQIYQVKDYLLIQKNNYILKIKFLDWKILGFNSNLNLFVLHEIDLIQLQKFAQQIRMRQYFYKILIYLIFPFINLQRTLFVILVY